MISSGVYIRGGLSFGSFYFDENIIFSNALVNAYNIENKLAIYPRIVVDKNIILRIRSYDKKNIISSDLLQMIYFDWENIAFLNPFLTVETEAKELEEMFNTNAFLDNPEAKKIWESLPESMKNTALNPYKFLLSQYEKIISDIQSKSINLDYSESVRNKYVWLIEFYKWKYENGSSMLHFKSFDL